MIRLIKYKQPARIDIHAPYATHTIDYKIEVYGVSIDIEEDQYDLIMAAAGRGDNNVKTEIIEVSSTIISV